MQSSVKNTYTIAQSRMMYMAYVVLAWMAIGLMLFEFVNTARPFPQADLIFMLLGGITAMMYCMTAMLVVEIIYQNEIEQMPFIASLSRLTPELTLTDRYAFLTISFKRQITSTISVTAFWIFFGGTQRGLAVVLGMIMITMIIAYGIAYLKTLPPEDDTTTPS